MFVSLPTGYGNSLCYAALPAAFDLLLKRRLANISNSGRNDTFQLGVHDLTIDRIDI